jgi:SRSO17 transposase
VNAIVDTVATPVSPGVSLWSELDLLHARIGRHFARSEPRDRALAYLRGLLAPIERKNGWSLARYADESRPDGMQRLLTRASWDPDAVRDEIQDFVTERIGSSLAILVVTEAAFAKRGQMSAGVSRQYDQAAGRFHNCQLGLFLGYVAPHGPVAIIDRELHTTAPDRTDRDDQVGRRTKGKAAGEMLARALKNDLKCHSIIASSVFGVDPEFRSFLASTGVPYVVGVPANPSFLSSTEGPAVTRHLADLKSGIQGDAWHEIALAGGRVENTHPTWARLPLPDGCRPGMARWLLVARTAGAARCDRHYLCQAPWDTPLTGLVNMLRASSRVDLALKCAREWVGLDHYQFRQEQAWYRHMTFVMAAHACLVTSAAHRQGSR